MHRKRGLKNQTQKVAAAIVQEPVFALNGLGMEHRCMYCRRHWHTHTLTNQHRKKASFMEMKTAFWELADPLGADILCPRWSSESSKSWIDRWRAKNDSFFFRFVKISLNYSVRFQFYWSFWADKWFRHALMLVHFIRAFLSFAVRLSSNATLERDVYISLYVTGSASSPVGGARHVRPEDSRLSATWGRHQGVNLDKIRVHKLTKRECRMTFRRVLLNLNSEHALSIGRKHPYKKAGLVLTTGI